MSTAANVPWPQVRLGDVLTYLDERVTLNDSAEYITITVKRRHGGLEERERLLGHQIQTKKQFRLVPGAFIISRVQCWHQAYAIVPDDIPPNMIASINYDQFAISPKVNSQFFWWLSHSPYFTELIRSSAFGVVIEKMVFDREAWLEKKISLPPLEEQNRIVARIEELANKVEEARGLRKQALEEGQAIWITSLRSVFLHCHSEEVALEQVCTAIIDNLHSNPLYSDTGVPCVRSPDVGWGTLSLETPLRTDEAEYHRRTIRGKPEPDDIILVREGGGTGKAALVAPNQRFSLGQRVMMLRPEKRRVLPRFFLYQLLSPLIQEDQIERLSKGSASPHLNIGALRKFPLKVPPLSEQSRIVTYLDQLQVRLNSVKALQTETSEELDVLMPSILDKAFRGDLLPAEELVRAT